MSLNAKEEMWVRKQVMAEARRTASQSELIEPLGVVMPDDARNCIAVLREALSGVISNPAITITKDMAAQLLNDTGDVALKYQCYLGKPLTTGDKGLANTATGNTGDTRL